MKPLELALVEVGGGKLALTHRPKLVDLARYRAAGVTHVATLLAEREGAKQLGAAVEAAGMTWVWAPLDGGAVPDEATTARMRATLRELADALAAGGAIVLHCSAGIHRTGMIGYALLRVAGLDAAAARDKLRELRVVTADGVGDDRLAWGDSLS